MAVTVLKLQTVSGKVGRPQAPMGGALGNLEISSLSAMAASFFDASEDCVKVVGLDGNLLAMNANGICLFEIDDFETMRGTPWADCWPALQRPLIETALSQGRAGHGSRFSAECPTVAGTPKSWDVVVWPVLDEAGKPTQLISISRDVTDRRRAEEQRLLFTRELAHRIKNTFAVVDGLIALSARSAPDSRTFAESLRRRIAGLGRAISYMAPPEFTNLQAPEDRSLHGLLRVLLAPYGALEGPEAQIALSGDNVLLGTEATTTVALIFNELATNAVKYGALRSAGGRITVQLEAQEANLRISWIEKSPGSPELLDDGVRRSGFGSALLERAVVRQLDGKFERIWRPEGLSIHIDVPLDRLRA